VAEQRRHSLRRDDEHERGEAGAEEGAPGGDDVQMSLFAVISAVATDAREPDDLPYEPDAEHHGADEIELALAPPPPLAGGAAGEGATATRREEKTMLRDANATVARELARRTRLTHAQVNAELNRLSGVRRVTEATIEQLERRLHAGDRWLARS
jgi:hypothetical protein